MNTKNDTLERFSLGRTPKPAASGGAGQIAPCYHTLSSPHASPPTPPRGYVPLKTALNTTNENDVLPPRRTRRPHPGGYTLAELMVALSIFGFSSTAISSLMFATYNTHRAIRGNAVAVCQGELALRRIIELLRSAVDVSYATNTGLLIQTPADSNNYLYVYTYYLAADPNNAARTQLHELIQRANNATQPLNWSNVQDMVVIDDILTFDASRVGATFPEVWQLNLVINGNPRISRSLAITGRNLTQ